MKKIIPFLAIFVLFADAQSYANTPLVVQKVYSINYDKNATGLVRHFTLAKEPKWVAKIETRGGKRVYFSSPKSMFEFYFRPGKWFDVGIKSERDFSQIVVTDYVTGKAIDGESAYYIYGSRAISPAGDDLVAIGGKEEADKFAKEYGGKRVLKFDEVSDSLIRLLNGRI